MNFLDAVEIHGKNVKTVIDPLEESNEKKTAAYEAKLIKRIVLKLREWTISDIKGNIYHNLTKFYFFM